MPNTYAAYAEVFGQKELAFALYGLPEQRKGEAGITGLDIEQIVALVADAAAAANLFATLGLKGGYYTKTYNGKSYVIVKGYARMRRALRGTRYLANNPKVVRLGMGPIGAASSLKFNAVLGLVLYAADVVVQGIAGDAPTLVEVTDGLVQAGADFVLSSVASALAGAAIGTVVTAAFPAFLGGVIAGVAVSYFFNKAIKEKIATRNFVNLLSNHPDGGSFATYECGDLGAGAPGCTLISRGADEGPTEGSGEGRGEREGSGGFDDRDPSYWGPEEDWFEPDTDYWNRSEPEGDFGEDRDGGGDVGEPIDSPGEFMLYTPIDTETGEPLGPTEADELEEKDYKVIGDGPS